MSRTSNLFGVSIYQAAALPSWISSAPTFQWVDIPNSRRSPLNQSLIGTPGVGVDPSFWGLIGYTVPTSSNPYFTWPTNKYGQRVVNPNWQGTFNWGQWCEAWGTTGVDDGAVSGRIPNLMYGGGDAHWQDNSIYRFYFGTDSPYWDVAVLGCDSSESKVGYPNTYGQPCGSAIWACDAYDLLTYPDDNQYFSEMYDGSPRGGHDYWNRWYCPSRDWLMHITQKQFWPIDAGYVQRAYAADLSTVDGTGYSRWTAGQVTPDWSSYSKGVEIAWGDGDPSTGDFYKLLDRRLLRWLAASNTWEVCWQWGGLPWAWDGACGAVNYTDGYVLMASAYHSTDAGSPADSVIWWKVNLADIPMGAVTPNYFINNQKMTVTGTYSGLLTYTNSASSRYTMSWVPEIGAFILFPDDGNVYLVTPNSTNPTGISIERQTMTVGAGVSSPGAGFMITGGVYKNFFHVPSMKICIARPPDCRGTIKAFRTQ